MTPTTHEGPPGGGPRGGRPITLQYRRAARGGSAAAAFLYRLGTAAGAAALGAGFLALVSVAADFALFGGSHYPWWRWRWYDNDAVAVLSWTAAGFGVLGVVSLWRGMVRGRGEPRPRHARPLLFACVVVTVLSPVPTLLHLLV